MSRTIPHSRPAVGEAEAEAVRQVVLSGHLVQGREVESFEEETAAFAGRRYGVAVSSGTAALHLALLALGMGKDDEVIVPSYVCTALLHAVRAAGTRPALGDIDRRTRNLNKETVERRYSKSCGAIIVPHMFGLPAHMDELLAFGIPVVEDCAMSIGAEWGGVQGGIFRGSVDLFVLRHKNDDRGRRGRYGADRLGRVGREGEGAAGVR